MDPVDCFVPVGDLVVIRNGGGGQHEAHRFSRLSADGRRDPA
ncbi:hypothetical protein FHR34_007062 [Kitasatospora kifunensis]|uniref:Uncharacterized protein n=1 Tax=Kitasatospora kifunensis TaxID=58351 RepID=A0A7W7R9K2_KITKI|nr:hypothetical protein [Kitasatospora kifunensis]